jgi:hypothetical protein
LNLIAILAESFEYECVSPVQFLSILDALVVCWDWQVQICSCSPVYIASAMHAMWEHLATLAMLESLRH